MSYIVPRDKPKQCNDCQFVYNDTLDCRLNKESYLYISLDKQYTNCPLIEVQTPHGRLIDADALIEDMKQIIGEQASYKAWALLDTARKQPTIIEAEGSENENNNV